MSNTKKISMEELSNFVDGQSGRGEIYDHLVTVVEDIACMLETSTSFTPDEVAVIIEPAEAGSEMTMRMYNTQNSTTVADRFWNGVLVVIINEKNEVLEIKQAYVTLLKATT